MSDNNVSRLEQRLNDLLGMGGALDMALAKRDRRIADLHERLAALEYGGRGQMGVIMSRPAQELASATNSVTLSRAQWTEVVGFLDRYGHLATGMAQAISDKTLEDVHEFRAEVDAALALIEQEARHS